MKKILMTLVAVAMATTMNAQTWIGGELGFSSSHVNGEKNTNKQFFVSPEIGYNLDDNLSVAIKLGYGYFSNYLFDEIEYENVNAYTINPYVRYAFVKAGNFSAFVDGGIIYTTSHFKGFDNNLNQFGAAITPGLAYAVSDKVTLVSHLGDGLYYNHQWIKDYTHVNNFGFNFLNSISFGAYYNF